ncbi:peptide chain release factor N(5)-glutamine methyltransferase [Kordiimonas sp.]|uniref:peptide chain release factor N(5)-glutamine methyltransferase n=1 Tax=Kordiimonas sp. TaxID=1970157 RepID=UPI003A8DEE7A
MTVELPTTAYACLRFMEAGLKDISGDCALIDAELLLSHTLGWPRMRVYAEREFILPYRESVALSEAYMRRMCGEPVAYILGVQEFWSLEFDVSSETLIPRADTETLVEVSLTALKEKSSPRILDLGTGTGCILLSLLHERADASGVGVDVNAGAVTLAQNNAQKLGLSGRAQVIESNWFEHVPTGQFDLITSNPPYIPAADIEGLMQDVRDYEPMSALDGGDDGLTAYRLITESAQGFMEPGGYLAVEIGIAQSEDVSRLFVAAGFEDVTARKDLAGINRVIIGKKS